MWNGWTGVGLEVDLTQGKINKIQLGREIYENYLGGFILLAKLFWDRVPPEDDPFSPNNAVGFAAGPLVGTTAPAACRTCVLTRSAVTNWVTTANLAGFWGPEFKFAGYDWIFITGKSPSPVYININNDKVEIRDASHLWGKDVYKTQQLIREELKDAKIQSLNIGPAGENRVRFADVSHGPGCSMARAGAGAIMGDKNLKAVAVRGTKNVNLARPAPFFKVCDDIMNQSAFIEAKEAARWPDSNGTLFLNTLKTMEDRLYRNFEFLRSWKGAGVAYLDFLVKHKARMVGCYNCQMECIQAIPFPEKQETLFWKCHDRHRFMCSSDIQDFEFSMRCFSLAQRYGMDTDGSNNVCRLAIELFQKGILTEKDTDGLKLEWGNPEVVPTLLEWIAHRQGIGDILAEGCVRAAQKIGRGAEQYVFHIRKLEYEGQKNGLPGAIRDLVNDRQGATKRTSPLATAGAHGYEKMLQEMKDPAERERWEKHLRTMGVQEHHQSGDTTIDHEITGKRLAYDVEAAALRDSIGFCCYRFMKDDNLKDVKMGNALGAELISYATGFDLTEEKAVDCARRGRAHLRAYNAVLGERIRASDIPTQLLYPELLADDRAILRGVLAQTMQFMGYTPEGIPTAEHLNKLGLEDVAKKLEQKGILPQPVSV